MIPRLVIKDNFCSQLRLPVGMFSAVPANLHRWHRHMDEVDVKMDVLFYTTALQTHAVFQSEQLWEKLTWVWVVWADRAQQVFLFLVVTFAEQLPFLEDELVPFPQLALTNAAAEAAQVVHALQRAHHELRRRDLLHAAAALGSEQPARKRQHSQIKPRVHLNPAMSAQISLAHAPVHCKTCILRLGNIIGMQFFQISIPLVSRFPKSPFLDKAH